MGGSSGGGGSGEVSWPQYLEDYHAQLLNSVVNSAIPTMISANPYTAADAFDPTTDLGLAWDAVCEFDAFVDAMSHESDYQSAASTAKTTIDGIIDDTYIDADIAAFAAVIDNQLNTSILPQFKAGMRDINAVMSSAFVLGEGDIYTARTREVTKYGTDLRTKLHFQRNEMIAKGIDRMLTDLTSIANLEGDVARVSVDAKRIAIVAQKEQEDKNLEIEHNDATWENEAYVYGGNMLAGISGGTRGKAPPSQAQSALSGGLSGAAIGAQIGMAAGGVGAVPGAIIGGMIGIGASFL